MFSNNIDHWWSKLTGSIIEFEDLRPLLFLKKLEYQTQVVKDRLHNNLSKMFLISQVLSLAIMSCLCYSRTKFLKNQSHVLFYRKHLLETAQSHETGAKVRNFN